MTIKKDMVVLLGQVMRREDAEANWMRLSFEEKMSLAESVLDSAVSKIKYGWDFEQELRRLQ